MLAAYIDESGHIDTPVLTIAAVVAPVKQWETFEDKWKRILRRYRVSMFHMADYESGYGEFAGWTADRRISFIADLAAILKNCMLYSVAGSLSIQDWKETILPLFPKMKYDAPYMMLLHDLLLRITEVDQYPEGETIACICDENRLMDHPATTYHDLLRRGYGVKEILTSITFQNKREIVQLQAADMVAYETYKYALHWDEHGMGKPRRKLLRNLSATECITMGRYNKSDLVRHCAQSKELLKYIERDGLAEGSRHYLKRHPPYDDTLSEEELLFLREPVD